MSLDWVHQFCLACDKQTDGSTYCSESCRLADFEKTSSSASSGAGSPSLDAPSWSWTFPKPSTTGTKFYLSPAYDFTNPAPFDSSAHRGTTRSRGQSTLAPPAQILSPSSSHSSLSSMRSTSSAGGEGNQLSEKAKRELRAYASSFESVRLQRRRSY